MYKILNPETGKYVNYDGKIGKQIRATDEYKKAIADKEQQYNTKNDKFLANPNFLDYVIKIKTTCEHRSTNNYDRCENCKHCCERTETNNEKFYLNIPKFIESLDYELNRDMIYSVVENDLRTFIEKFIYESSSLNQGYSDYGGSEEWTYVVDEITFKPKKENYFVTDVEKDCRLKFEKT